MTSREAITYCYNHRNEFIHKFDSIDKGVRQFDLLVEGIRAKAIKPNQLGRYGMRFEND